MTLNEVTTNKLTLFVITQQLNKTTALLNYQAHFLLEQSQTIQRKTRHSSTHFSTETPDLTGK